MEKNLSQKFKEKLESERESLLKRIAEDEKVTDFGSDVDGLDEEADEADELSNKLATVQTLKERVNEIDAALNRMVEGKYGVCEKCGKEIENEVLEISPESRYCRNCKSEG
ncbi:MAG: TraR/DksA C4-type zinc finger protein [Patescibacteria group bacterium]